MTEATAAEDTYLGDDGSFGALLPLLHMCTTIQCVYALKARIEDTRSSRQHWRQRVGGGRVVSTLPAHTHATAAAAARLLALLLLFVSGDRR